MAGYGGIELREIVFEPGDDHLRVSADIYAGDTRVGEIFDDGWCDEIYFEFIDEKCEKLFIKKKDKYCKRKNIDISINVFLGKLMYESRIKMLLGGRKKTNDDAEQISFL